MSGGEKPKKKAFKDLSVLNEPKPVQQQEKRGRTFDSVAVIYILIKAEYWTRTDHNLQSTQNKNGLRNLFIKEIYAIHPQHIIT